MRAVIYGLPKSGTTYLFSLLAEAMTAQAPLVECFEPKTIDSDGTLRRGDGMAWPPAAHQLAKILYADSNQKSGWNGPEAQAAFAGFDKKIFLVRDPRDRWISGFFYRWFHLHNPDPEAFYRALRLTEHKEKHPDEVPFHQLHSSDPYVLQTWAAGYKEGLDALSDFLTGLAQDGWFILHYEDLVDKNWAALEAYLGFSLAADHGIRPSFKHVSRTNSHSNWRRWFTPDDEAFFKPVFGPFLHAQGYNADDWQLETVQELPAAEGSGYMHRLFHHPNGPHALPLPWKARLKKILKGLLGRA